MRFFQLSFLVTLLHFNSSASASVIENGFKALEIHDYFKAKSCFYKALKKEQAAASFGLATIYVRNNNPFYNLDSAFKYCEISVQKFELLPPKKLLQFERFHFTKTTLLNLRQEISSKQFQVIYKSALTADFYAFITKYSWSTEIPTAYHLIDSLDFQVALKTNTALAFKTYLGAHENGVYQNQAIQLFNAREFEEYTQVATVEGYASFLKNCQNNPYFTQAEDQLFSLVTKNQSLSAYDSLVRFFPDNRNVTVAWRKLYQLFMVTYSSSRLQEFKELYPSYPYFDELETAINRSKINLLPFQQSNSFGFMDMNGIVVIPASYESLNFFKEDLALASKDGKYGYIDRNNKIVLPFIFSSGSDFEKGRALVEKNGLFGYIDRTGKELFPIVYKDLGSESNGLIYAKRDSLYAYYTKGHNLVIPDQFEEAFDFVKGFAKVQIAGKQGLINEIGQLVIPAIYESLNPFNDSIFVYESTNLFGLISTNGKQLTEAIYQGIGSLSNDRAIIVQNNLIGYLDSIGNVSITPKFDLISNFKNKCKFSGEYAITRLKGKFGVIHKSGKVKIPFNYSEMGELSNFIAISKGKNWTFIDINNREILKPVYTKADSFINGFAKVEKAAVQLSINLKGEENIPFSFTELIPLNKNLFIGTVNGKKGIYSSNGKEIVSANYDQIRQIDAEFCALINNQTVNYFYLTEMKLIEVNTNRE